MRDSAATGSGHDTVDTLAAREAEVAEEQHLDERHATGEHYVSDEHRALDADPLADVYLDDPAEAAADDPELNAARGVDNI